VLRGIPHPLYASLPIPIYEDLCQRTLNFIYRCVSRQSPLIKFVAVEAYYYEAVAYPGNSQGGAIFAATKIDDLFWEANICRPFSENDNFTTFFYSLIPVPPPYLRPCLKGGGGNPPVHLSKLLVFFKPSKIIFRQPKGGGPWPPSVRHCYEVCS
jgi:hypothetical protein